jgi:hypothetical protein
MRIKLIKAQMIRLYFIFISAISIKKGQLGFNALAGLNLLFACVTQIFNWSNVVNTLECDTTTHFQLGEQQLIACLS